MPLKQQLSLSTFINGFNSTVMLDSRGEANWYAPGSRNQLLLGPETRPWRGLDFQGQGARKMVIVGSNWGGLRDNGAVEGTGSFFQDIGRSLWFIGSGVPQIAGTDVGAGIVASTTLKVSIAVNGVYDITTTYDAGLPQPSTPDVGIIGTPGVGFIGEINNAVSFKIARLRLTTGARSIASPTSAVVVPVNQTVRVTFPLPADGQTDWALFSTQQGFGGVGLHYRTPYNDALDIPESVVAAGVVDGVARSLEIDFVDGDLVPEVAYIDDYPPPAGTH